MGSAFKNRIIFNKTYQLKEEDILSFSEYGDVIIFEGNCYILHEDKFNSIFKFREKLDSEVSKAKDQIENLQFLDNAGNFYDECNKNFNTKRAVVKVKMVNVRTYQRTFERILKKLNINVKNFHALRHTFATRAIEMGMDVKTVSEILGHNSPVITLNRYSHSLMSYKTEMMAKMGKMLDRK